MAGRDADIHAFIDSVNEHSKVIGRTYDLVHKGPDYALWRLKDEIVIFDGKEEFRLPKGVVYEVGKDLYLLYNHRDVRERVEGFDRSSLTPGQTKATTMYGPALIEEAVDVALSKAWGMDALSPEEVEKKIKEDKDFARELTLTFLEYLVAPLPRTIEERHKEETERDRKIMKGFGLEEYLHQG